MSDSVKGWAGLSPIIRKFAGAKGGRAKVPKGLALQTPERRKEIASMGGKKKYENIRNNGKPSEAK